MGWHCGQSAPDLLVRLLGHDRWCNFDAWRGRHGSNHFHWIVYGRFFIGVGPLGDGHMV
jgi:hypothetical protein